MTAPTSPDPESTGDDINYGIEVDRFELVSVRLPPLSLASPDVEARALDQRDQRVSFDFQNMILYYRLLGR